MGNARKAAARKRKAPVAPGEEVPERVHVKQEQGQEQETGPSPLQHPGAMASRARRKSTLPRRLFVEQQAGDGDGRGVEEGGAGADGAGGLLAAAGAGGGAAGAGPLRKRARTASRARGAQAGAGALAGAGMQAEMQAGAKGDCRATASNGGGGNHIAPGAAAYTVGSGGLKAGTKGRRSPRGGRQAAARRPAGPSAAAQAPMAAVAAARAAGAAPTAAPPMPNVLLLALDLGSYKTCAAYAERGAYEDLDLLDAVAVKDMLGDDTLVRPLHTVIRDKATRQDIVCLEHVKHLVGRLLDEVRPDLAEQLQKPSEKRGWKLVAASPDADCEIEVDNGQVAAPVRVLPADVLEHLVRETLALLRSLPEKNKVEQVQVVATLPVNTSSKVSHMYELCLEKVLQASYPNKTIRLHCITEPEAAFLRFFHTSRPLREALSSSQGKAYFIVIDIGHGTVDQVLLEVVKHGGLNEPLRFDFRVLLTDGNGEGGVKQTQALQQMLEQQAHGCTDRLSPDELDAIKVDLIHILKSSTPTGTGAAAAASLGAASSAAVGGGNSNDPGEGVDLTGQLCSDHALKLSVSRVALRGALMEAIQPLKESVDSFLQSCLQETGRNQVFLLRVGNGHGGLGVTEAIDSLLQGRPHIKPLSHETFLKPVTEGALLYGMHLVRRSAKIDFQHITLQDFGIVVIDGATGRECIQTLVKSHTRIPAIESYPSPESPEQERMLTHGVHVSGDSGRVTMQMEFVEGALRKRGALGARQYLQRYVKYFEFPTGKTREECEGRRMELQVVASGPYNYTCTAMVEGFEPMVFHFKR